MTTNVTEDFDGYTIGADLDEDIDTASGLGSETFIYGKAVAGKVGTGLSCRDFDDTAHVELHLYAASYTDRAIVNGFCAVDFLVQSASGVPMGNTEDVLVYATGTTGSIAGRFRVAVDGTDAAVTLYDDTLAEVATATLTLDTWYAARFEWTGTSVHATVSGLVDETLTAPATVAGFTKGFAGGVGDGTTSFEVVLDNAELGATAAASGGVPPRRLRQRSW